VPLSLFLIAWLTGVLVSPGHISVVDTTQRLQVARWIWAGEDPMVAPYAGEFGILGVDGRYHPWYGVGQSLVLIPFDIASTFVLSFLPGSLAGKADALHQAMIALSVFPLLTALCVLVAYRLLRELEFAVYPATAGALSLLFATSLLSYTNIQQESSLDLLCFLFGAWCFLRWHHNDNRLILLLGALVLTFSLLTRVTNLLNYLVLAAMIAALQWCKAEASADQVRAWLSQMPRFALITGPVVALGILADRWYQFHRFGSLTSTYIHLYGEKARAADPSLPETFPFSHDFWMGMGQQLFGFQKSLFLYELLFTLGVLVLIGSWRHLRLDVRLFSLALLLVSAVLMVFYAPYVHTYSLNWWGNRFLMVSSVSLAMMALPIYLQVTKPRVVFPPCWLVLALLIPATANAFVSILFWGNLEALQAESGIALAHSPLLMRWMNAAAWLTDNFEAWGLAPESIGPRSRTPNFLPFLAREDLPSRVIVPLQLAWFAGWGVVIGWVVSLLVTEKRRFEASAARSV
jgi:hypothetical protein